MGSTSTIALLVVFKQLNLCHGWNSNKNVDENLYTQGGAIGWQSSFSSMSITIQGCVYGQVNNLQDLNCLEKGSQDGTYSWYQMVNCRRAQVAFSVYASNSGSTKCYSGDFIESMVTMGGVEEFVELLGQYGADTYITSDDLADIPICEEDGYGYYEGIGCSENGDFVLAKFTDAYCLSYYSTSASLSGLTYALQKYQCYDCSSGLCKQLSYLSDSCSPNDYSVCEDITGKKMSGYKKVSSVTHYTSNNSSNAKTYSFKTKVKYTFGCLLLLSSFVMFLGILATNRRKRRATMATRLSKTRGREKARERDDSYDYRRASSRAPPYKKDPRDKSRDRSKSRNRSKSRSSSKQPRRRELEEGILA